MHLLFPSSLFHFIDVQNYRILVGERMLASVEDMEVGELGRAELCLGEHAFYHLDEEGVLALDGHAVRFLHEVGGSERALAAGIARVAEIFALVHLVAVENHFVGVDHDHVVTAIEIGCLVRFLFAAKDQCHLRAETAEHLVGSVNHHPFLLDCSGGG